MKHERLLVVGRPDASRAEPSHGLRPRHRCVRRWWTARGCTAAWT